MIDVQVRVRTGYSKKKKHAFVKHVVIHRAVARGEEEKNRKGLLEAKPNPLHKDITEYLKGNLDWR